MSASTVHPVNIDTQDLPEERPNPPTPIWKSLAYGAAALAFIALAIVILVLVCKAVQHDEKKKIDFEIHNFTKRGLNLTGTELRYHFSFKLICVAAGEDLPTQMTRVYVKTDGLRSLNFVQLPPPTQVMGDGRFGWNVEIESFAELTPAELDIVTAGFNKGRMNFRIIIIKSEDANNITKCPLELNFAEKAVKMSPCRATTA